MRKAHFRSTQICIAFVALLSLFSFAPFAHAQFNASLSGTVIDPSGAVIPGATVTLTNMATQAVRTATSTSQGTYQFSELPPGDYSLSGAAKGFQGTSLDRVTLVAEAPRNIDLKLQLGAADQTVTVSANEVTVLNTSDASLGNSLSSEDVTRLPPSDATPTNSSVSLPASSQTLPAAAPDPASSFRTPREPASPTLESSRQKTRSTPPAQANVSPPTPSSSTESASTASPTEALPSSPPIPNP